MRNPYPGKFALVDILLDVIVPVLCIALIDGKYLTTLWDLHGRIRQDELTQGLSKMSERKKERSSTNKHKQPCMHRRKLLSGEICSQCTFILLHKQLTAYTSSPVYMKHLKAVLNQNIFLIKSTVQQFRERNGQYIILLT